MVASGVDKSFVDILESSVVVVEGSDGGVGGRYCCC